MDKDYSVSDFAALAGVSVNETQRTGPAGQAKGDDPMPAAKPGRTKHPLKDKLVGEASADALVGTLMAKVQELEARVAQLESGKFESSTLTNEATNLKSRQKSTDSIKSELYSRLNKLMDN
jgi:hypothetical protein